MKTELALKRIVLIALIVLSFLFTGSVLAGEVELVVTVVTYIEDIPPNIPTDIDASEEAGVVLEDFISTELATVTVSLYEENPHPEAEVPPESPMALGIFLEFEATVEEFTTEIRVYYTDEEVEAAGIDEGALRLYYFDYPDWIQCVPSGVNTFENYVWAVVDHFTVFAPFGVEAEEPEPEPGPSPPVSGPNKSPVADAGLNRTVYVEEIVEFNGSESYDPDGAIMEWTWIFGDGKKASGETVSHVYSEPGNYTVTLKVKDWKNAVGSDTCMITVREIPPIPEPPIPPPPPLPPILDNLNITPVELEFGDSVTIGFDLRNIDSQNLTYIVKMKIENVNDPPVTSPPYKVTLTFYVELEAYEFKTVSWTIETMNNVGDFNVTLDGLTGSFTVKTPPFKLAEFEVSNLAVSQEEVEEGQLVNVTVYITNLGEAEGTCTVDLILDGEVASSADIPPLKGGESWTITFVVLGDVGTHVAQVGNMTVSFTVLPPPEPPEEPPFLQPGYVAGILTLIIAAALLYAYMKGMIPSLQPRKE